MIHEVGSCYLGVVASCQEITMERTNLLRLKGIMMIWLVPIYIYILPSLILPPSFQHSRAWLSTYSKKKSVVVEFMILLCLLATKLEFVSFFTMDGTILHHWYLRFFWSSAWFLHPFMWVVLVHVKRERNPSKQNKTQERILPTYENIGGVYIYIYIYIYT
jgi:hypothetical protein